MKQHPCKECIIRSCCRKDCGSYYSFRKSWCFISGNLSLVISTVVLFPIIILTRHFEFGTHIFGILYFLSIIFLIFLEFRSHHDLDFSILLMGIAPITIVALIFIKIVEIHTRKYSAR